MAHEIAQEIEDTRLQLQLATVRAERASRLVELAATEPERRRWGALHDALLVAFHCARSTDLKKRAARSAGVPQGRASRRLAIATRICPSTGSVGGAGMAIRP